MGRRGKRRRAKDRLQQPRPVPTPPSPPTTQRTSGNRHDPWHPVLRWWWALGLSICAAGAGLMPVSFWWAVGLVYAGISLLLVGLRFERFNRHAWLRWV